MAGDGNNHPNYNVGLLPYNVLNGDGLSDFRTSEASINNSMFQPIARMFCRGINERPGKKYQVQLKGDLTVANWGTVQMLCIPLGVQAGFKLGRVKNIRTNSCILTYNTENDARSVINYFHGMMTKFIDRNDRSVILRAFLREIDSEGGPPEGLLIQSGFDNDGVADNDGLQLHDLFKQERC